MKFVDSSCHCNFEMTRETDFKELFDDCAIFTGKKVHTVGIRSLFAGNPSRNDKKSITYEDLMMRLKSAEDETRQSLHHFVDQNLSVKASAIKLHLDLADLLAYQVKYNKINDEMLDEMRNVLKNTIDEIQMTKEMLSFNKELIQLKVSYVTNKLFLFFLIFFNILIRNALTLFMCSEVLALYYRRLLPTCMIWMSPRNSTYNTTQTTPRY